MKAAFVNASFALVLLSLCAHAVFAEEPELETDPEEETAPAPADPPPLTHIVVGNGKDTNSTIRIENRTAARLTAHWVAVPKTATEKDYDFPFPNPVTLGPGESADIPVTIYAESIPGFLHLILEILARDVAYRFWSPGDVIEDWLTQYNLSGLGYRVNEVFFGSFDFEAVGLTSDEYFTFRVELRDENGNLHSTKEQDITIYDLDRPPVLAIRGTEPSEADDWYTNFDPDGVGFSQFFFNRETVEDWLRRKSDPEQGAFFFRPHITGHSLGGALSQWFGASYTSSGYNLGEIVTFASPGIMARNGFDHGTDRFDPNRADSVTHYITSGDIVSLAGRRYLPGSIRQATLNPAWVESQYIAGPASVFNFDHPQYKHSVPVLAPFIHREKLIQNPVPRMDLYYDNSDVLNDFFYTFIPPHDPDPDYFAFLQMVASSDAANPTGIAPLFAAQLNFRGTLELNREAIGRTLWATPLLATRRIQKAWEAAQVWPRQAWGSIQAMTKKIVGSGSTLAKVQTGTVAGAVNFWEASARWPEEAWEVSTQWQDFAWKAMESWTAAQWEATVRADFPWHETPEWTQEQWENVAVPPTKTIGGRVFDDANGNGQDDTEPGRAGQTIFVDLDQDGTLDDEELKTTTQGNGEFNLITSSLSAGTHHIRQVLEDPDWQFTEPADGQHVIELNDDPNQVVEGVDFGNQCVGECEDVEPPDGDTIVIGEHAFLRKYTEIGEASNFTKDTDIDTNDWACGVVGFAATGGDFRELYSSGTLLKIRARPNNQGRWQIQSRIRTGYSSSTGGPYEEWDVTLLCLSSDIAAQGSPEPEQPIFFQTFRPERDNIRYDTGISIDQYACGLVGVYATGGDPNENGTGDIVQTYLYREAGTWQIRADFRTHNYDESWREMDVLCINTDLASLDGAHPDKSYFIDRFTSLGDNIRADTGIPVSDYVCGVIGHAALHGDIDENYKSAGTSLYQNYMFAENDSWKIRADFRTHKNDEDWDVNVLCAQREGATPDIPLNISREERGIENCMGESMKCQVLHDELVKQRGDLILTGGGYSGHPTQTGHRCGGPEFVEVYINDREPDTGRPLWSWPNLCLESGDRVTLFESTVYDLRSVSLVDGTTVPFQLTEEPPPPPNRPPTIAAPEFHGLYWKDSLSFDIKASDPDGHQVTILADGLPDGASISPTSGTGSVTGSFSWRPDFVDIGDHHFTVRARDGKGSESTTLTIFIKVCESPECLELF